MMRSFSHRTPRGLRLPETRAADLARLCEGLLEGDSSTIVIGATSISAASIDHLCFWSQATATEELRSAEIGVLLVPFGWNNALPKTCVTIQVADPYASMVHVLESLHQPIVEWGEAKIAWDASIHPSAVVEGVVWPGAVIGPLCVVPVGSEVGWNTILEPRVTLYPGVQLGNDCRIQSGVVIGAQGFGFRTTPEGRVAVPHYAGVEIGDRVQIGANSVVAAGFLEPTRIGDDTKLDSFVQIAHHCQVGSKVMMASGAGLAGGVCVEDGVEFGGAAQVAQHIRIGRGARIAARSGVTKDIAPGMTVAGFPAEPIQLWRKGVIAIKQLAQKISSDIPS